MRIAFCVLLAVTGIAPPAASQDVVQFIFAADPHYGLTRATFRGQTKVDASVVSGALVAAMNALPNVTLPADGGVHATQIVGPISFVAIGGDIANRAENGVQAASVSWQQFEHDYLHGLTVRDERGRPSPLFVVPGNHDLSNAIGSKLVTSLDPSSMVGIFNLMMASATSLTATAYNRWRDEVHATRVVGGLHLVFLQIWPDSAERRWLAADLDTVALATPVLIFVHDPPAGDPKHFAAPATPVAGISDGYFENLLAETYRDDARWSAVPEGPPVKAAPAMLQRELAVFIKAHPNIKAYFHGHSNSNEFYVWRGPDNDVALPTFRVDSPMKGAVSATDETRLSFQLVTIDRATLRMTVRECLWDAAARPIGFGALTSVSLR